MIFKTGWDMGHLLSNKLHNHLNCIVLILGTLAFLFFTCRKWLTNPVRKLSTNKIEKGTAPVLEGQKGDYIERQMTGMLAASRVSTAHFNQIIYSEIESYFLSISFWPGDGDHQTIANNHIFQIMLFTVCSYLNATCWTPLNHWNQHMHFANSSNRLYFYRTTAYVFLSKSTCV
jgi:hypothetical protein